MSKNIRIVKAYGPVIVGIGSLIIGYITNWKVLKSKSKEEERNEINKTLSEFYGPFTQLRKKSDMLYRLFTKGRVEHCKTLPALLNGDDFSGNDKSLLHQIILINRQLEDLIINKSGYVVDSELRHLLGEAATYFNVISLAYDGLIKSEMERFEEYLFPRGLDNRIEAQIERLNKRLKELK